MNRFIILMIVGLLAFPAIAVNEQSSAPAQEPAKQDYKNRPDPCDVKHQKKSQIDKTVAPAARKSSDKPKR